MTNNKNLTPGNPETQFKTGQEQVDIARKGGIASGEARRLNKRLANLTKYTDRIFLTKHKRKFRKLWKLRHKPVFEDGKEVGTEQVRDEIRDIIENMRIIKDCGGDVLNIVAIANSPYLAISKPEVVIKAQAELWDRREGKAVQSVITTGSSIREKVVVTQEEIDKEKKAMAEEFKDD